MVQIQFYHLTATPLDRALPKLLEKVLSSGFRVLVVAGSDEQVDHLNHVLWTYDPGSFLPHGSMKDGHPEQQPILLSTHIEAVNDAKVLLVTNGTTHEKTDGFERILDMFDGRDAQAVANARTRWTSYKNAGCEVAYLRQTDNGGWEKKSA